MIPQHCPYPQELFPLIVMINSLYFSSSEAKEFCYNRECNYFRSKREEARITAWENLQKAKADAAIRKLEVLF